MSETAKQIEQQIEETKTRLNDNITELENKVKTAVDWRAQVDEHPWTMLAVAFGGGVLLAGLLPSIRSSRYAAGYRYVCTRQSSAPEDGSGFSGTFERQPPGTLADVKGALLGTAANKLGGFLEGLLPGFNEEFDKARSKRNLKPTRL